MEIAQNDFNPIWGNLIISGLYIQTFESRLVYSGGFKKHPAILLFAKRFAKSNLNLLDYIVKIQKEYIRQLVEQNSDFSNISKMKDQLYLYYIISERVYNMKYFQFFKNNNFNFGCLDEEDGYESLFKNGIEDSQDFTLNNPIFQVYNQQFRYNLGLNINNTLDIEIVEKRGNVNPFESIKQWANK